MPTAPAPAETAAPGANPAIASHQPDARAVPLRTLRAQRLVGADTATLSGALDVAAATLPKASFTSAI